MTEINLDNGHGAADGFDEEFHFTSDGIKEHEEAMNEAYGAFSKSSLEGADDESPLNGSTVADTQPPSGNGFLEQWEMFSSETLQDLEQVCQSGLTPLERIKIIKVGFKLIAMATINAKGNEFDSPDENVAKEMNEIELLEKSIQSIPNFIR